MILPAKPGNRNLSFRNRRPAPPARFRLRYFDTSTAATPSRTIAAILAKRNTPFSWSEINAMYASSRAGLRREVSRLSSASRRPRRKDSASRPIGLAQRALLAASHVLAGRLARKAVARLRQ